MEMELLDKGAIIVGVERVNSRGEEILKTFGTCINCCRMSTLELTITRKAFVFLSVDIEVLRKQRSRLWVRLLNIEERK